jgi:two-component SAPR family response regulator
MKDKLLLGIGRKLMKLGRLRICIIDDKKTYFNPQMLEMAAAAGFPDIERYYLVDEKLFMELQQFPPDIIILDIKGITIPSVAKDGFSIASVMYGKTNSYIVITSAHKYYLKDFHKDYDYIIEDRLLTGIDFIEELEKITEDYLNRKIRFYKKVVFRIGFRLIKKSTLNLVD